MLDRRVPYSSLVYVPSAAHYRGKGGRFLSPDAVRQIIEADIDATKDRMEGHARRLQGNEIDVEQWRVLQAKEVKYLHLAHLAAAKGGFHNLDSSDYGRAGQIIKGELAFVDRKAQRAALDPEYRASERFVAETRMYGNAGLITYEATRLAEEQKAGFDWEVNILNDGAHHCEPKGGRESCQQQTDKGVVRSGTLVRFGFCVCGPECRCKRKRFKTKEAALAAIRR